MVTDARALNFTNARIRPAADALAHLYEQAKLTISLYYAQNIGAVLDSADQVADGSPGDGRPEITGQQGVAVITRLIEFVADYEANSNAKLNTVYAVAPNP